MNFATALGAVIPALFSRSLRAFSRSVAVQLPAAFSSFLRAALAAGSASFVFLSSFEVFASFFLASSRAAAASVRALMFCW